METTKKPSNGTENVWNSLEVCKLIVGLAVPLVIFYGTQVYSSQQESARMHDSNVHDQRLHDQTTEDERTRKQVDRRFEIWDKMAYKMDQIYSYFLCVGDWKETSPEQIIKDKRELDDLAYSNKVFFSGAFFDSYSKFTDSAFATYRDFGSEPALKTIRVRKLDKKSKVVFLNCDNSDEVYKAFWAFQEASGTELDLPKVAFSAQPKPMNALAKPCQ